MNNSIGKKNCVWVGIGINIFPEDQEYKPLFQLNKELNEKFGSSLLFDHVTNQPHINLYDIDVPRENLAKIEGALQQIAANFSSFTIMLNSLDYFNHGTIFIKCEINDYLKNLEQQIVDKLNIYRENYKTEDYWQPWKEYNEEQINNREKYGNPYVLNTFTPHITLGFVKVSVEELRKISEEVNQKLGMKQMNCDHIDLVVHDNQGKLLWSKRFLFNKI